MVEAFGVHNPHNLLNSDKLQIANQQFLQTCAVDHDTLIFDSDDSEL